MKKVLLYSIKPEHIANILNGLKTIELRKHAPKPPFVMWIYVTKAEPYVSFDIVDYDDSWGKPASDCGYHLFKNKWELENERNETWHPVLNGLVVAKCVVETVTKLQYERWPNPNMETYMVPSYKKNGVLINDGNVSILEGAKLNLTELIAYGKGKPLYALHLTQLEILDKPLQVSEFGLTRAPQSYQKVIPPEVRK